MHFDFSPEQLEFKQNAIRFARKELGGDLIARDRDERFPRELWAKCADFGILGLPFPEQYGGTSADILSTMLLMEGLGYGCTDSGLIFALPALCHGELLGAHGMTEPDSGSDAFSLRTSARREGETYVLNGTKTFSTNAPEADVFIVFATVDRAKGFLGITAFIVEKTFPGFHVGKAIQKMGLRTVPMGELILEDCRVPAENRLGREGNGAAIFNDAAGWERTCILASLIGAMERQLETCVAYARQRKQFNKPIGKFQSGSNKIADMKVRLETSRLILYKAGWAKQTGQGSATDSAIAKLYLSEAWVRSCLDAVQIHGGYGYTVEYELERDLRDAVGSTIYSGTSEIQRNIIASYLGL
jgi:alkylation response protein AidB-like acyl-CoA dehydrogenase